MPGSSFRRLVAAVAASTSLIVDPLDHWTSLNRTDFTQNTRLQDIAIEHNHIITLGVTLAKHRQLRTLLLNDNPAFDLDASDVAHLVSATLLKLELAGCKLTNMAAGNRSFAGLPQLRTLNLDRNHMTAIPVDMLAGTNVSALSLCGNEAFNFPAEAPVLNSSRLTEFRCNRCGISSIYTRTFALLPALERLELNGNRLKLVNPLAFTATPRLAVIHLNDNSLQTYPLEALRSTSLLHELCLDCNNFISSFTTNDLKRRYVQLGLRGHCPNNHTSHPERPTLRLEDIVEARRPGISDAYIASYLVVVVLVQAVSGVVLLVYWAREARRQVRRHQCSRRGSECEFDYAAGVVNDSCVYRYVR